MAITGKGCFGSHGGCERPHHCNIPSSNIFYDGETIEEAGLYHGMPLDRALANLAKYVSRGINVSGSVNTEVFDGTSHVVLKKDPAEICLCLIAEVSCLLICIKSRAVLLGSAGICVNKMNLLK